MNFPAFSEILKIELKSPQFQSIYSIMIFSKAAEKKTTKARSKPSEYEAMLRNGFIMPKLNSTIVNRIYMYRVKSQLEYCPMTTDIKAYKICINPPSKDYLLN